MKRRSLLKAAIAAPVARLAPAVRVIRIGPTRALKSISDAFAEMAKRGPVLQGRWMLHVDAGVY